MQETMRFAVGIDIGTTCVRCVIGHIDSGGQAPTIVGVGSAVNTGMRKGVVVNIVQVAQAIDKALDEAERMSGHQVNAACASINGTHITDMNSKGVIAVNAQYPEITEEDVVRVQEAATVVQLPPNREIMQVNPRSYQLDGQENIKDPIGMSGVRLEVDAHVITALSPHIKNVYKTLGITETNANNVLVAGLAAAKAVLTQHQCENGVALVDIGGTTTSVVVYEEGDLQHIAVLPMGSVNITNDLAIGLRTDLEIAEVVKLEHVTALKMGKNSAKSFEVKHNNETYTFAAKDAEMVVQARLDEIFEQIDSQLASIGKSGNLPGGVVLTGGGANLQHLADYAKQKLHLPVRLGKPDGFLGLSERVTRPEFATALGLMMADLTAEQKNSHVRSGKIGDAAQQGGRVMTKLFGSARDVLKKFKA